MNRRFLINLALLFGAIVLGVVVWLTWPRPSAPRPTVSALAPSAITHIAIRTRENLIQLARDGAYEAGHWRMQVPVAARADPRRVAPVLALAAKIPAHRYASDAIDDATTGLDNPAITLRFNDEAPIAIGNEGPSPGTRYVRTAHALLLVKTGHLEDAPLGWSHWIAPRLTDDDARLAKITLPRLTLTRDDTGVWQVEPDSADRGADYAQATADAWHRARALDVEPLDAARERIARVTLRFADRPPRHLDVIARRPELVLRDDTLGVDYHLAASQAGALLDMQHPSLLGRSRGRDLKPSAIPLRLENRE